MTKIICFLAGAAALAVILTWEHKTPPRDDGPHFNAEEIARILNGTQEGGK